jgi:hypothetical protein
MAPAHGSVCTWQHIPAAHTIGSTWQHMELAHTFSTWLLTTHGSSPWQRQHMAAHTNPALSRDSAWHEIPIIIIIYYLLFIIY